MPPRKPGLSLVSLAIATLAASWSAGAQAQSLVELYEAARGFDASYLSAKLQYEAAQSAYEQRKAIRRPTVNLQGSATRNNTDTSSRTESATSGSGTAPTTVASSTGRTATDTSIGQTDQRVGLSASQPLFNRTNDLTVEQAERQLRQAELNAKSADQELIVRVSQAYFDMLASLDNLKLLGAQKVAIQEQLASARRRFEVGTATIIDTREAQASYDLILAQEVAANGDLAIKKSALEQLVGKRDITPHPVRTGATFVDMGKDEGRWIAQGEANPQLQIRRLDLEIARLETRKAQAGHLPTVALTASMTRSLVSGSTLAVTDSTNSGTLVSNNSFSNQSTSRQTTWPGASTQSSVGVVLNMPLFSGFSVQNRVKETLSLEAKAEKDLEGTQRTVAQSIRSAFFKLMADQGQVKALEAAELSRQSALDANRLGYQVGVGINIDVLNSQSLLFQTRRDLARVRYDVLVGGLRLKQVAGVLTPEDLGPINTQLVKP